MRSRCSLPLLIVALAAILGPPAAGAQARPSAADSAKRVAIRRLLVIQRTDSLMLAGIEQAFQAQRQADPNLPAGFMDEFMARVRRDIGQFVDRLVPVYDSLYSADEVTQLLAFYQTPLGQRLLATQPPLMQAVGSLGEQWGMEVAGQVLVDLARRRPTPP